MSVSTLRCDNLTLCYRQRPVIHHLSVELPCGALVGVVGPNGAGKSTLLRGMLGWLPWTTGRVTWAGQPIVQARHRLSFLAQGRNQDMDFPIDVASVVAMGRYAQRGLFRRFNADDRTAIAEAIAVMGIAALERRPLSQLSGGQQQRTFIARALATGADVLLLDEPLTGLDEPSARDLLIRLQGWVQQQRLVVAVIHDLHAVRQWCTHTLLLNRELIAFGPTAEVLTPANLERCYGASSRTMAQQSAAHAGHHE